MPTLIGRTLLDRGLPLLALTGLLLGCGRGSGEAQPATAVTGALATQAPAATTTSSSAEVVVETLLTGLDTPWDLAFAPDGRIYLTERPGRVRVVQDGKLLPEPLAVIEEVADHGEGGLLGIALDPNFADNRALYLYYTYRSAAGVKNRIVRYTEADARLSDPQILFDEIEGAGIHNGGRLAFGPDGKLYFTTGDAAVADLAQDLGSPAGKIHRINPDGSLPEDNPFPNSSIYSYGHRNSQGLAWQPATGQLYATEHGSSAHDEVNRITPGANYGWPIVRGAEHGRYTAPISESGGDTWAPSGAAFVSSDRYAGWQGSLIFASLRGETLWRLELDGEGQAARLEPLLRGFGRLRAVSEGPDGLLYVLTSNRDGRGAPAPEDDRLLRLVPR